MTTKYQKYLSTTILKHATVLDKVNKCLSLIDINEDCNIMKAEETSLCNERNMLVSELRQLVEYYTHSYTLKGLEGNALSVPNKNIISIQTVFLVDFSSLFEKSQIQGISHCQPSSCIYGKNTRKNMYDMLKIF